MASVAALVLMTAAPPPPSERIFRAMALDIDRPASSASERDDGLREPAPARPWRQALGWALAIGLLAGCLYFLDLDEMQAALARLTPAAAALILLLATLDRFLMAFKWRLLLRLLDIHLSFPAVLRIYYQATISTVVLPPQIGGDLVKAWLVMRAGGGGAAVAASLVMEKLLGLLSAANWAILGGMVVALAVDPGRGGWWVALGLAALVAGNLGFALSLHPRVHDLVLRLLAHGNRFKPLRLLHKLYAAYSRFGGHRGALLRNFALTSLEHALQMAIVLVTARSLGIEAPTIPLLAAIGVQLLLLRIPIAPSGWGVGEITAIVTLGFVGVRPEAAFTLSVVGHVVALLSALPGLVFFLRGLRRGERTIPGPAAPPCRCPSA